MLDLVHAAQQGDAAAVVVLLRAGHDIDRSDNFGWTPLHEAALNESADIAQLLLEAGDRELGLLHDLHEEEDGDQLLLRSCDDLEGPFYSCLLSLVHFDH